MVYEEFLKNVKSQLEAKLGDSHTFAIRQVTKNNGLVLDGLCISLRGEKIAPTIYLNDYYSKFRSGTSIPSIVEHILNLYQENTELPDIDLNRLTDFSLLKDKIAFKLIHHQSNLGLLKEIPHIPYLDLAIVFYILLESCVEGQMTALVLNEHMNMWNLTPQNLYEIAKVNTPRCLPPVIKNMTDVLKEFAKTNLGDQFRDQLFDDIKRADEGIPPLFVLSNESGYYGAGCMLYENVLKLFSESTDSDFIILPSSIHEVLLIPSHNPDDCQELSVMVSNINQTGVSLEDRLSNQVYYYRREENKISLASSSPASIKNKQLE